MFIIFVKCKLEMEIENKRDFIHHAFDVISLFQTAEHLLVIDWVIQRWNHWLQGTWQELENPASFLYGKLIRITLTTFLPTVDILVVFNLGFEKWKVNTHKIMGMSTEYYIVQAPS